VADSCLGFYAECTTVLYIRRYIELFLEEKYRRSFLTTCKICTIQA